MSLWLAGALVACDDGTDPPAADAGGSEPPADASSQQPDAGAPADAAPSDAALPDAAPPPGLQPPFTDRLPDTICGLEVGARCDGSEDCPDGQRCCAKFDPVWVTYKSIACQSSCGASNEFELCHPGEACTSDQLVCRSSLIIPYNFIGVCAAPEPAAPMLMGDSIAGAVACGDVSCAAGSEQCCLRARYDFNAMSIVPLEPYCAPLDHICNCDHVIEPPDAGPGTDEDAGV